MGLVDVMQNASKSVENKEHPFIIVSMILSTQFDE
jgi:hypothetical protein